MGRKKSPGMLASHSKTMKSVNAGQLQTLINSNPANRAPLANTMGPQSQQFQQSSLKAAQTYEPPTKFFFDHNFDEKGALYYLGSLGKRRLWQNPHRLGLV